MPHTVPPQQVAPRVPQGAAVTQSPPVQVSPEAQATPPQQAAPRVPHCAGSAQVPALH